MSNEEAVSQLVNDWAQGKDFVLSQAPEVIQQLLLWGVLKGVVALAALLIVGYLCVLIIRARREVEKRDPPAKGDDSMVIGSWVIVIVLFGITWGVCIGKITDAIKIAIAPKLYILQYAVSILP